MSTRKPAPTVESYAAQNQLAHVTLSVQVMRSRVNNFISSVFHSGCGVDHLSDQMIIDIHKAIQKERGE